MKIQLPHSFLGDVYGYQMLGPAQGMIIAMILPWFEIVVGCCLLGGVFVTGTLLACMALAVVFIFAISWALYYDLNISCGCFGSVASTIGYGTLARAIIIFLVSGLAYIIEVISYSDMQAPTPLVSSQSFDKDTSLIAGSIN